MRSVHRAVGCLAMMLAILSTGKPARADSVTLSGLTFSDELGGMRLVEGSGSGQLGDPFVLVEEITGNSPAILTIRGFSSAFGNRIGSQHVAAFALTKIVYNKTGRVWSAFDLELRETPTRSSPYEDGLSFGQASVSGRPFLSDGYSDTHETAEPFDSISFLGGLIRPDERVAVTFVISDMSPRSVFYLVQSLGSVVSQAPDRPSLKAGSIGTAGQRADLGRGAARLAQGAK